MCRVILKAFPGQFSIRRKQLLVLGIISKNQSTKLVGNRYVCNSWIFKVVCYYV
jgi:hypothetical protein